MATVENERWIAVPKNEKGKQDCDYGDFDTENVVNYNVPEKEFRALIKNGAIDEMNIECDLLIQDYESEIVMVEQIETCMSIIKERGEYTDGVFMKAFESALSYGTYAELEF